MVHRLLVHRRDAQGDGAFPTLDAVLKRDPGDIGPSIFVLRVADGETGVHIRGIGRRRSTACTRRFRKTMVADPVVNARRGKVDLVPVPYGLGEVLAVLAGILPNPPLTRDQIILMKTDNVVGANVPALADLGIEPRSVETVLPTYMERFRARGRRAPV